ncbi:MULTISPECIES: hypothetical protein [Streptomyces]|uniref:Uncharacterized protein n=2 Tax=Streptomyces violaceusniger group TaxID=2839105 RepID=A0ABD5J1K2_9ACTN|nr:MULTISPECIES: hypothetical protein [Streptomyces]MEE4582121.1 hypothetical protein [Streptomyces sp. DSM 41602]KUL64375.1 hypothetical protein ADL28_09480 [Streptomyces violaceusniger]RSS44430.1 hypothetical protein EF902_16320 [Streptomyces sp. WAC05858]WTA85369.1 hypothetical protein OG751_38995 [Streptomyces antimycoticus]WTB04140.1 hypothetical protein OG546_07800 [Streptomyces antimycoticus]
MDRQFVAPEAPSLSAPNRWRGHSGRLRLPDGLPARLGYDAVGMPADIGRRVMKCLPRIGCVFSGDQRWWWIVPSGSHIDVAWPSFTSYAVGAHMADLSACSRLPRLVHHPQDDSPYTPPIPLYFMTCHIAGIRPHWSPEDATGPSQAV